MNDCYDTMTLCMSKGLCCPMGAAVITSAEIASRLKVIRKSIGGGLWHYTIIAAAGNYALDHTVSGIKTDNQMAKKLATNLSKIEGVVVNVE